MGRPASLCQSQHSHRAGHVPAGRVTALSPALAERPGPPLKGTSELPAAALLSSGCPARCGSPSPALRVPRADGDTCSQAITVISSGPGAFGAGWRGEGPELPSQWGPGLPPRRCTAPALALCPCSAGLGKELAIPGTVPVWLCPACGAPAISAARTPCLGCAAVKGSGSSAAGGRGKRAQPGVRRGQGRLPPSFWTVWDTRALQLRGPVRGQARPGSSGRGLAGWETLRTPRGGWAWLPAGGGGSPPIEVPAGGSLGVGGCRVQWRREGPGREISLGLRLELRETGFGG